MKKYIFLMAVIAITGLVGCSSGSVKQKVDELTYGQSYSVDELFEVKSDGVVIEDKEIVPDELGEFQVSLNVEDGEEQKQEDFVFNVVDKTAPEITQIKDKLVLLEPFNINDFISVKDDVDTNINVTADASSLKNDTVGEYKILVSAKDTSSNASEKEIIINVVEPFTDVKVGDTVNPVWENGEAEVVIKDVAFMDEVHSTSDNMFRNYYADVDGEKYFVIKLSIKNLGGKTMSDNDISGGEEQYPYVKFDNKYEYGLSQLDSTSMVMSPYWSIQPLKSLDVYLLQSVPDEVTSNTYTAYFSIGGNQYKIEK